MRPDQTGCRELSRGKRRAMQQARMVARAWPRRHVPSARDRGTVLLMVLGVLALMAIIAVVYAAIGKGDRVSSTAGVRQQRIDDQVDAIAQYFSGVLRDDVHATYPQEGQRFEFDRASPVSVMKRELFDYPYTDKMMVSQALDPQLPATVPVEYDPQWQAIAAKGFYRFSPEGTIKQSWHGVQFAPGDPAKRDPRSPSDPFLAATEPTFRNRETMDWTWTPYGANEDYLNLRDWAHISNFAPSGNFVNLWALRNNFRAESGFYGDADGKARLSALLTLINPATGYSYALPPIDRAIDQDPNLPIRTMRSGSFEQINGRVIRPTLNHPADWTHNQAGLFRTVAELPTGNGAGAAPYGVDDPEYLSYQVGDADGDGFYDSRWFELVDIFDAQNPRPLLTATGRPRLFIAARCADLSALVNVNTASDFQFEPKRFFVSSRPRTGGDMADPLRPIDRPVDLRRGDRSQPGPRGQTPPSNEPLNWQNYRYSVENSVVLPAGLTPADIDLQRLLRLSDPYYAYTQNNLGVGYDDLPQPPAGVGLNILAGDYRNFDPNMNFRNEVIGNAAYQALWDGRLTGGLPTDRRYVLPDLIDPLSPPIPPPAPFIDTLKVAQQRYRYFDNFGNRRDPGRLRSESGGALNRYGQVFDEADELELRTFQGLNDPDRTSRLEATVAGRTANQPDLYPLSPFRDNRAAVLERAGRDLPARDLNNTAPSANDDYRKALLAAQIDVRRLVTTMSGARPLVDNTLMTVKPDGSGDPIDTLAPEISESAGSVKVDASRLVSTFVEPGNFSFNRNYRNDPMDDTPRSSDPCDFIINNQQIPPMLLANIERENTLDDLGWFEPRPDNEKRPWYYQRLDNRPDLPPLSPTMPNPFANSDAPKPLTGTTDRNADRPDEENYTTSRLDAMREAFRAYLDCLLPYTQWGVDPAQPTNRNGPFPDAWDRDPNTLDPRRPNLTYGGDPELAYQIAATMAINLRDACDTDRLVMPRTNPPAALEPRSGVSIDPRVPKTWEVRDANKQTAVTLDLTAAAMGSYSHRRNAPNNPLIDTVDPDQRHWVDTPPQVYARDPLYPWPKLNPDDRTTPTDDAIARQRLSPVPANVRSTGHPLNDPNKQIIRFGIEPQPFIIQVTSIMLAVDTPHVPTDSDSGDDEAICSPDPTEDCQVTINVRRLIGVESNPDFLCYLIAFQVTNPFETDIVLEPEDPSLNNDWYYIEYANRFYRLVPKDSRQPVDGMKRDIPESQRILRAGETKTFYATYPNSVKDISDRIRTVQRFASFPPLSDPVPTTTEPDDEDGDITGLETTLARIAKHEFGENCVNVAPMYPETGVAIGAAQSGDKRTDVPVTHRLTNIDLFAISSSFSPGVLPLGDGPNGENRIDPLTSRRLLIDIPEIPINQGQAWSNQLRDRIRNDPRRRVYLWRVMRDPDSIDGNAADLPLLLQNPGAGSPQAQIRPRWNSRGNDLMLDRLYDPSPMPTAVAPTIPLSSSEQTELQRCANGALVQALIKPFSRRLDDLTETGTTSNLVVPGTNLRSNPTADNSGFTLASWVSITRPLNPPRERQGVNDGIGKDPDGRSPVGAMPPWCMEARQDNILTPGFRWLTDARPAVPDSDEIRRSWSLNTVRKFCGIRSGLSYKLKTDEWATPYYRSLKDFLASHTKTVGEVSVADSSYSKYPSDYGTGNSKSVLPKFIDPELSVRFAERRGAKTLPHWKQSAPSSTTNAPKGDPRQAYSIVEIDEARSMSSTAETDDFYNMPNTNVPAAMKPRRFDQVAVEFHALPPDATDSPEAQATPSRALFSRVGDFLLPLAVGPSFDPAAGAVVDAVNDLGGTEHDAYRRAARLDTQWMTLAEALALASDYYSGPKTRELVTSAGGTVIQRNIYYRFARDTRGQTPLNVTPMVPKGDRGQLVLDAWSPYIDYNPTDTKYKWSPIDPGVPATLMEVRDAPLGNGIPLALNILDKFRVAGLPGETTLKPSDWRRCIDSNANPPMPMQTAGNGAARAGRRTAYGSATQSIPGLININTAPMAVLRTLPMISPSRDLIDPGNFDLRDSWLYDGRFDRPGDEALAQVTPLVLAAPFAGANNPLNPQIPRKAADRLWRPDAAGTATQPWDIAATIGSYRDQSAMITRRFNNQPPILIDYRDNRDGVMTNPPRSGRDDASLINTEDQSQGGLRDGPGFKSVGEVMALGIKRSTDPNVVLRARADGRPATRPIDVENSIDRMALDGASNRSLAIDSTGHKLDRAATVLGAKPWGDNTDPAITDPDSSSIFPRIPVADGADTIADDYDEKLSIANAILNTVTVRSDLFCIWFIVNGYTPEDVQVDDGFPLIPSIAKRYVMVVDRSNVAKPTDKPKIVMLREVPMP